MLDPLTIKKLDVGLNTALDPLPDSELACHARNYIIACLVEGKSPRTIEAYSRILATFITFNGNCQHPTADKVRTFLFSLQQRRLKPYTIWTYYRSLKTFFNWLVAEGVISKSPMSNIKPTKLPKMVVKPFSRQDIDNLLLLCSGTGFIDLRNRAIILMFLDTGLRLAELAEIQLVDIDFRRETIKIMGKGARERVVRIGKTAQKALLRYILLRKDDYPCLWVTEERIPLSKQGIRTFIKRLCRRAEIRDARPGPHTFRHTAAINCLRNGMGEFTLQMMLGHSSLEMTRRYVSSLSQDDVIEAHKKYSPVDCLNIK